jgi:hypothetical protein
MNGAMISTELVGKALPPWQRALAYITLALLVAVAIWVVVAKPYTPGSKLGYNLGLVGGCLMLVLLLHPARKHWSRLHNVGTLRGWFAVHLVCGIVGPLLILFHSTFQLHSFNAAVAFWCMMVVVASGAAGRFAYLNVYRTLGERHAQLYDMEGRLDKRADKAVHAFDFAPQAREWLEEYRSTALGARSSWLRKLWRLVARRGAGARVTRRASEQAHRALTRIAKRERWAPLKLAGEQQALDGLIGDYMRGVDAAMRYAFWERALAWWHIAHGPLVIILVLSAVAHVVAVHLY